MNPFEKPPSEDVSEFESEQKSPDILERAVGKIRTAINKKVEESKIPAEDYESTVGIYGGKLVRGEAGKMVYDTRGIYSKIDKWGDKKLRGFDEHHVREAGKMLRRHPGEMIKRLPFVAPAKRFRRTPEEILENMHRLGLDEYYGVHPWGIEIKKPEIYTRGINLKDIYRVPELKDIDRFEALAKSAEYIRNLHDQKGDIGEVLAPCFIFLKRDGAHVENPVLNLPTVFYENDGNTSEIDKKATDLLDFLASSAAEEWRRSEDWENISKALHAVLDHYGDPKVIAMVRSFVKRGRLTLGGDLEALEFETSPTYKKARVAFAAHNTQRIQAKKEMTARLREELVKACEVYLNQQHI